MRSFSVVEHNEPLCNWNPGNLRLCNWFAFCLWQLGLEDKYALPEKQRKQKIVWKKHTTKVR